MRFHEFKLNLLEASGGMWNRMQERRQGQPVSFSNNGETLDLLDVQVFPQNPKIQSYKEMVDEPAEIAKVKAAAPIPEPTPAPTWKGRQQPAAAPVAEPEEEEVPDEEEEQQKQLAERAQPEPASMASAPHIQVMLDDILQWIQSQGATIEYAKPPTNKDAAAMVVILGGTTDDGVEKKLAFVNWAPAKIKDKVPPMFWKTIRFEESTGWIQGNAGKSATAKAALLKMDPADLLEAGSTYNIASVPDLIANGKITARTDLPNELLTGIPAMLNDLLNSPSPVPTPNLEKYERELEVVLGETAAPIALMTGNRVSGAYNDVTEQLLQTMVPPLTWADFSDVIYGKKGGKVEDCSMYAPDGTKLMVSSKDSGGGAPASLTGFMETIEKYSDQFGPGTAFYEEYEEIFKVLELLHKGTGVSGILAASVQLEFIDEDEEKFIKSIYNTGRGSIQDAKNFTNLQNVLSAKGMKGAMITNAKGDRVVSKQGVDTENFKYQFGYHLLGNLAVMIQKHFAKDQDRVTKMFKSVLNRADMVQVYTKVGKNNQGLWFEDFKVTWPPTFNGKIVIIADHYTANAPAGKKISFYFK